MLKQNLIFNRADRISALGRITLAVPTLAAALIDPPQPKQNADLVIALLSGYAALAIVFAIAAWWRPLSARPLGQWAHGIDLLVFAALVTLTRGIASPFFPFYLFAILSATLRWDWRGALGTSVAIIVLFVPTAFANAGGLDPGSDDILRFVIRIGQVVVVGGLLVYIGRQRERYWNELLRLSQPVEMRAGSTTYAIGICLDHAREFFGVPTALLAWEIRDEPGWRVVRSGTGPALPALPTAGWPGPVAGAGRGSTFDFDATARECRRYDSNGEMVTVAGSLLDPVIASQWAVTAAAVTAINSDTVNGWLIIPKRVTEDDLYLARALSVQLAAALDNAAAAETWQAAAASEERIRVAHDLHDGILQFLTGLALQLRLMEKQVATDPAAVSERIRSMAVALRREQQDLRHFLEDIRPRHLPLPEAGAPLAMLIPTLAQQWDIAIDARISAEPPARLADEIRLITREAIANAVRHGGSKHVTVTGGTGEACYQLDINDTGTGFVEAGRFDAATLRATSAGPRSILDRLDRLDGDLILDTGPAGTRLSMTFPLSASDPQ